MLWQIFFPLHGKPNTHSHLLQLEVVSSPDADLLYLSSELHTTKVVPGFHSLYLELKAQAKPPQRTLLGCEAAELVISAVKCLHGGCESICRYVTGSIFYCDSGTHQSWCSCPTVRSSLHHWTNSIPWDHPPPVRPSPCLSQLMVRPWSPL